MNWWLWMLVGLVLCTCEVLLTPGVFVLLFFGISAFIVAAIVGLGLATSFWMQIIVLAIVAIGFLVLFRKKATELIGGKSSSVDFDALAGCTAIASDDIPCGVTAKVEFRGSSWNAINTGSFTITKGDKCKILKIQGLLLSVEKE